MIRFAVGLITALAVNISVAQAQLRVEQKRTASGLEYIRVGMPGVQFQSLQLVWRDGSPVAREGAAGLASAIPYLMGRGPRGEKLGDLTETLRDHQASFSFYAGTETSGLSFSAPPEHFAAALAIFKRYLDDPALPEDRLDTFRRDAAFRVRQALKKGETQANQLRIMMLLPPGPMRTYHLTDVARLDTIRAADVAAWKKAVLGRDTVKIVTAGPMRPEDIEQPLASLIADLPAGEPRLPPAPQPLRLVERPVVLESDVPQTIVQAFGATTVGADITALKANFSIQRLGGGAQGRLFAALRDRLGATYGAQSSLESLNWNQHVYVIRVAAEHDKAAAAIAALKDEYRRWWEDGMTEAEFAAVKSAWRGTRSDTRRQSGAVAGQIASAVAKGWSPDYFTDSDRLVDAFTREDINAYIRAHFPKELSLVVVAPKADGFEGACVIRALSEAPRCGL